MAWFKKLGIHFISRIALNAYIAWKNKSNAPAAFMDFLETVARELLMEHNSGAAAFSQKLEKKKKVTISQHQFVKWEKIGKRKRCRVCHPTRRDTPYFCPGCPEKPGLCSMTHFHKWHGKEGVQQSEGRQEGSERVTTARQTSKNLSEGVKEAVTPSTSNPTPATTDNEPTPSTSKSTPAPTQGTSKSTPDIAESESTPSTSERITKRKSTRTR